MRLDKSISLGSIAGIPIKVDLSWFILFSLVTATLTLGYFPMLYPEWNLPLTVGIAILSSLLFFISVLAHELSHSIVAKRLGVNTGAVTLFILGGMSQIKDPQNPAAELRIALVGTVASLAIGFAAVASGLLLSRAGVFPAIAIWIGEINIMLGFFNLMPAFPMDGGRVLQSILWRHGKSQTQATKVATISGCIIGSLLIAAGVWALFSLNLWSGIWVILLGWFLASAAHGEYKQVDIQDTLRGHHVREVMRPDSASPDGAKNNLINNVLNVSPDDDLLSAIDKFVESGASEIPVVINGTVIGIVEGDSLTSYANSLKSH